MKALNPLDLYDVRGLLSEEEQLVQDTTGRFVDEKVLPIISECFEKGRFPKELIPEIA
ncbi:MAG TPA: acyl-CoA dehydrogenase family protein, partial [Gammaproteobacteria bacterium]|nr:acyl-CoA dehydrogenase family protein [Gammaproteobacteria bacterium]